MPPAKKALNGFYFSVTESIIFNIVNNLVVGSRNVIHGECCVAVDHDLWKFYVLEKLGGAPASVPVFQSLNGRLRSGS